MPIIHAIVHHIQRHADSAANLAMRNCELPHNDATTNLLDKLKGSFFSRISREHGSFDREAESPPPLAQVLETVRADAQSFTAESIRLTELLAQALNSTGLELDAHLFLFIEKNPEHHAAYLFMVQKTHNLTIDRDLGISQSDALDYGQTLFGIKVDIAEWQVRKDYAYLSLLPPRGAPALNDLFRQLTGFANGINKQEATLSFLEGVEAYSRELPADQLNDYRSQVVGYCIEQDQQDEPIDIRELANSIDNIDRDSFFRAMTAHQFEEETPFRADKRSLQRYVKFAGREKDLAISFSSYQLNSRVRYDADNDTLSIKGIPKALRNQILEHLKA